MVKNYYLLSNKAKWVLAIGLLVFPLIVMAADSPIKPGTNAIDSATNVVEYSSNIVSGYLQDIATRLFFGLALLQFLITGFSLIMAGEIEQTFAKYARLVAWLSICAWLIMPGDGSGHSNAYLYINNPIQGLFSQISVWMGVNGGGFDTGSIFDMGIKSAANVTTIVNASFTHSWAQAALSFMVPELTVMNYILLGFSVLMIFITCGYIAIKVFMVKVELNIMLMMLPLSLSFLGLNALKDQGFAPFKMLIALVYRTLILAAVAISVKSISEYFLSDFLKVSRFEQIADIWSPIFSAIFSFVILAFMAHKSDSIAASLANGSASLGSSDLAGAAAAGAAAAAVVATGGAAAVTAGKGAGTMADTMKQMLTGGGNQGSVSNASPMGTAGAAPVGSAPPKPSASLKEGGGANNKPPVRQNNASGDSAPPSPSNKASTSPGASPSHSGSGLDAGIQGGNTNTDNGKSSPDLSQTLDKLSQTLDSMSQPKSASLGDKLSSVNDHVAREGAPTHISINHGSD